MPKTKTPELITIKDFENLNKKMDKRFDQVFKEIVRTQKWLRLEIMSNTIDARKRIEENLYKFKDELFTRIDPILTEVENARIDRELSTEQTEDIKNTIKKLQERISKLESRIKPN